ncbi:M16 family metallopeptidase [Shewanella goraebulensis]|uniref:M16 family metallopeptidase n=1 Tax=Shewanella goraebulensis TaxID=3050637 RepID=UPI002549DCE8|nr:insulinase family protein [Shewanella goraebulensis]
MVIAIKKYQISILLSFSFVILGCQHSPINFTDAQPPNLPEFTVLEQAPSLQPLTASISAQHSIEPTSVKLSEIFTTHTWPIKNAATNSHSLNRIYFIGLSATASLENPDVLIEAFSQRLSELANQQHLPEISACYNSIRFRASLHSITTTMQCSQPIENMLPLILGFWDIESLSHINIETVQRNLNLNKHIGAFTGSEIDKAFRNQLLGKQHPYNLNIANQELVKALDEPERLSQLHRSTRDKMQWHLFSATADNSDTHNLSSSHNLSSNMTREITWPSWLMQNNSHHSAHNGQRGSGNDSTLHESPNADPDSRSKLNQKQTIYLIDAPDTVQTQVRLGFITDNKKQSHSLLSPPQATLDSSLGCKTIAPLLGRSYTGRLFYDLRETRGLTYGIYGRCIDAPLSQYLYFYGNTALENSGAFIKGIVDHTQLITQQTVSQTEIDAVATYLMGQRQLSMDNTFGRESDYIRNLLSGKSAIQAQQQVNAINSLTPEQLRQLSIETLSSVPTIVLRGDADKISQDINEKLPNWKIERISAN